MSRALLVKAWHVAEGDLSPAGARVVSVHRDPSRGHVLIGLSNGRTVDVAGERKFLIAERAHDDPARVGRMVGLFTAAARIGRGRR